MPVGRTITKAPVSEDEASTSDVEVQNDEVAPYDFYGNLKTTLMWDPRDKHLHFGLRQYAETPRRFELKYKGQLDTVTGNHRIWGHLRKNFYTHTPTLHRVMLNQLQRAQGKKLDEPELNPRAWVPGGLSTLVLRDWALSPGITYDSARSSHPLRYTVSLKKNPQVIRQGRRFDCWLAAKSLAEFDPKQSEVTASAGVRLKMIKYSVTEKQDVKLSLGWDVDHNGSRLTRKPFFKVAENNLALRLQRGRWAVLYEA